MKMKGFDQCIKEYIKLNHEGGFASTVSMVVEAYGPRGPYTKPQDYYQMFDSVLFGLGVSFAVTTIIDDQDREIGFLPWVRYHENNKVQVPPKEDYLINPASPFQSEIQCQKYLAKELVYMLMRVENLQGKLMLHCI